MRNNKRLYRKNGIMINPGTLHRDQHVKILYDGLLNQNGATHVYAHVGFDKEWNNEQDYPMVKKSNGFEVRIQVEDANTLNVAFKDCANNWDNNSGQNYTFDIADKLDF